MHGLETLMRLNAGAGQPECPGKRSRQHPRINCLRDIVAELPVDDAYRRWLFRSLSLYADEIVARPQYAPDEGWDDLEALQQVTLGDMMETWLKTALQHRN